MSEFYSVRIVTHDDSEAGASFYIEPPVRFISPEAKNELVNVLRNLIICRMNIDEAEDLQLAITHNMPDESATVGRAYFKGLELGTGAAVLQQALELGLNGSNDFISPLSPINN